MANIVEDLSIISTTIDNILDFVASDEQLSKDFEQYIKINDIEIDSEQQFNNIIIQYILDMKMQNGLRVLEYYKRKNPEKSEIIEALSNSFCSIFKVKKVLSNAFDVNCLTSNVDLTLIPLVKMLHLKQIGKFDYIEARILDYKNETYILEIYDVISEFNAYKAITGAVKHLIQNPKSAFYKNPTKKDELRKSSDEFYSKFNEYFKQNFIITTNKKIDELLANFNSYRLDGTKTDFSSLIEKIEKNKFFKISEYETNDSSFLNMALGGFSTQKETYDVALWVDNKRGLYVIPFFETFLKCFEEDIEGKNECIREFLTNDKIPPSVIKFAKEKFSNFFDVTNEILNTNFSNLEELFFNTKTVFAEEGIYSPITVLFNSDLFSQIIKIEQEENIQQEKTQQQVGRNELCPCGSGLKYKKCCGKSL